MQIVDISILTAQLLTVSGIVKILVDLIKIYAPKKVGDNPKAKFIASLLISVAITAFSGISIFETENTNLFYLGTIGAGFIAGLQSNIIHDVVKVLQTIKDIKKK